MKIKMFQTIEPQVAVFCTVNRRNENVFLFFVTDQFLQSSNYHTIINYRAIGFSFI